MTVAVEQEQLTQVSPQSPSKTPALRPSLLALLLTPWCILVHGYHPYTEDGGLYLATIKRLIDPELYPFFTGFVTAHSRFSLFPHLVAGFVRASGVSLMPLMFLLYAASIWLTLFAGGILASRCVAETSERVGSVLLLAAWLSIPVAGTSLMLMDPYVTSRNFSTPLSLLALAAVLDALEARRHGRNMIRPLAFAGLAFAGSLAMHPLMSVYTLLCIVLLVALSMRRGFYAASAVVVCAIGLAGCVSFLSSTSTTAYLQVGHSRTYWFLQQWRWFEWCGVLGPVAIFGIAAAVQRSRAKFTLRLMTVMPLFAAAASVGIALLFARLDSRSLLVASTQPLRQFHLLYCIMILGIGAAIDRALSKWKILGWSVITAAFGIMMFVVQRETFPSTQHIEAPWSSPVNPWEQAFFWIKGNTQKDAVFALDAKYISHAGEDAHSFKAIAERSALPDYSKDGGIASIRPQLAEVWKREEVLGDALESGSDLNRAARLKGTPIRWIVLQATSVTQMSCPYRNNAVAVCHLP